MAVVTVGEDFRLDMHDLELRDLYNDNAVGDRDHIEVKHAPGDFTDYYGSFTYDSRGFLNGGVLRAIESSFYGALDFSITGLDVDAVDYFEWAEDNETDAAFAVMFRDDDTFYGGRFDDWLEAFGGDDFLFGGRGNDDLFGGDGDDFIDGEDGADFMQGDRGNDVFVVDNAGDRVLEYNDEGFDLIRSSVSYGLAGTHVEDLLLTGSRDIDATGNSLDNILEGNDGDNRLDGGTGEDFLEGGEGDDTYVIDDTRDRALEFNREGYDRVVSSVSFGLAGTYIEELTLTGSANLNATGNSLDNYLVGNAGRNTLVGGTGDDTFVVQTRGDLAVERSGQGFDTVRSSVDYDLSGQYIERLIQTGDGDLDGFGNSLNNQLYGNEGDNRLSGEGGYDLIDGGGGQDRLRGGELSDRFVFDSLSDSTVSRSDLIVDLTDADRIDLRGIDADTGRSGDQAFRLVDAFSGRAGQAVLDYDAGSRQTALLLDVDGDGRADSRILISGDHEDHNNFLL